MRFSEYIVLGSAYLSFDPTHYLGEGCGCFVGMATSAKTGIENFDQQIFTEAFPWIWEARHVECPVCHAAGQRYSFALSCLAAHVALKETTFEQALEFVRMLEPAEAKTMNTSYGLMRPTLENKHA